MKRMFISFVLLFLLVPFIKSQTVYNTVYIPGEYDRNPPQFGDLTIHVAFATYEDLLDQTKMALDFAEVDTTAGQIYPVMFNLPDGQSVFDYLQNGGEPISYYDLWNMSIPSFFRNMTNDKLRIRIEYIKNPDREDGLWILGSDVTHSNVIVATDSLDHLIYRKLQCTLTENTYSNSLIYGCSGCAYAGGPKTWTPFDNNINMSLVTFSHELGHSLLKLGDRGDYSGVPYYKGNIDNNFMGISYTLSAPYDLMFHNGIIPQPYTPFSFKAFHTQGLIHQGYFDTTDIIDINENSSINKSFTRLKAVRKQLTGLDIDEGVKRVIRIPVNIDVNESGDLVSPSGSKVEAQHFLVEYRNGSGYDDFSPMYHPGESKGILISHVINSNAGGMYAPILDIEAAVGLPEGARNPADFSPNNSSLNGTFYNGRHENDWMDDLMTHNGNTIAPQGGKWAWWKAPTAKKGLSLPTDFFNATDRNKFTPSTWPSTNSWKQQDTHIAVYINSIEGDYANITVYRNYYSKPLETGITTISNDGYIGENFIVKSGATLELDNNSTVSLISGTNMTVKSGATLKLKANSNLFVEIGATITIEPGAIIEVSEGARIKVTGGTFNASNVNFTYTSPSGYWYGIKGYPGSHLSLSHVNMSNLRYAVSGSFDRCNIHGCTFLSCGLYGINLVNTNDYEITNNTINGTNSGKGISLIQSNGNVKTNTIANFDYGVYLTSSSPLIFENTIQNNAKYGLYATGYNSYPQLIIPNPESQQFPENNTILNNGVNYSAGAQIFLTSEAKIYLNQGCNNIYMTPVNQTPAKPCIKTSSISNHRPIMINAENNYWGGEIANSHYFEINTGYELDYTPFSSNLFPHGTTESTGGERLLKEAISNDNSGNYAKAQSGYETLICDYPNTKEAYVASALLPSNLKSQGKDLSQLINSYEDKISKPEIWNDTKFFEEMLVSGKMTGSDYETALAISIDMKENAETPQAKALASIDIAISKSMLSNGRKANNQLLNTVEKQRKFDKMLDNLDLYAEMLENGEFRELSKEISLPKTFSLSQNYPNPFNPTTTISYSLPNDQFVSIKIFNIMGKEVANLVNKNVKAGVHAIEFNGSHLASGQYFYKIETSGFSKTRRMLLIK